jgi:hypothetical protein
MAGSVNQTYTLATFGRFSGNLESNWRARLAMSRDHGEECSAITLFISEAPTQYEKKFSPGIYLPARPRNDTVRGERGMI